MIQIEEIMKRFLLINGNIRDLTIELICFLLHDFQKTIATMVVL